MRFLEYAQGVCLKVFLAGFLLLVGPAYAQGANAEDIETIYVVQPKVVQLGGRVELSLLAGGMLNSPVVSQAGAFASVLYHVRENLSLELLGGYSFLRLMNDDAINLKREAKLGYELVKHHRFPWRLAFNLQWTPIHGKIMIQKRALAQFGLYASVGAGVVGLELMHTMAGEGDRRVEKLKMKASMALSTNFGGGVRMYLSDQIGVRLDVRDYVQALVARRSDYPSKTGASSFDVTHAIVAMLGVGYVF